MTFYLVRHGLAQAGVEDLDPGLAPAGHEQAAAAARWLCGKNALRLAVSPLRRTRETAAPIGQETGLALEVREEVAEVFAPSMPAEQRSAMIGPFMAGRWADQPPQLRAWRQRVVDALIELGLEAESGGGDLIVVSHYIAIGVAIGEATGDDRVVPVPMANCAISSFELVQGRIRLIEACATSHLPDELITGMGSATLRRQ